MNNVHQHKERFRYFLYRKEKIHRCLFRCFLFGLRFYFFAFVLFLESFHAAGGIHNLLLTSYKGMAVGANFNLNILFGGSGRNYITAYASYGCFFIFGMNAFFHVSTSPPSISSAAIHFAMYFKTVLLPYNIWNKNSSTLNDTYRH